MNSKIIIGVEAHGNPIPCPKISGILRELPENFQFLTTSLSKIQEECVVDETMLDFESQ